VKELELYEDEVGFIKKEMKDKVKLRKYESGDSKLFLKRKYT
jgi:hypothetical protein